MNVFYDYPIPIPFFKNYIVKKSIDLISNFIQKNKNVALALSFGKDSMVLLHLLSVMGAINKIKLIMFNRSGFDAKETLALRDYVIFKYNINNYRETCVKNSFKYLKFNESKKTCYFSDFVYNVLEKPRWNLMDKYEIDSTLIGLRNQESKGRKINFAMRGFEYYNKREKANILQPLARWTTEDIFRYSFSEKIPIHPVYNRSKKMGFNFTMERVNMLIDNDNAYLGDRISKMKILYPNDYNDIVEKIEFFRR